MENVFPRIIVSAFCRESLGSLAPAPQDLLTTHHHTAQKACASPLINSFPYSLSQASLKC